jgi:hypothetical protein
MNLSKFYHFEIVILKSNYILRKNPFVFSLVMLSITCIQSMKSQNAYGKIVEFNPSTTTT